MKKQYTSPELEIVAFDAEDVITASNCQYDFPCSPDQADVNPFG